MSVVDFQDLPMADRDRSWDGSSANKRVRDWANAQDGPTTDTARRSSGTTPITRTISPLTSSR